MNMQQLTDRERAWRLMEKTVLYRRYVGMTHILRCTRALASYVMNIFP